MKILAGVGFVALGVYALLVALLYVQQRRLVFPASADRTGVMDAGLAGFEDVVIRTPDGETLTGWWKPPEPGRALILYFHGNGGSLWNRRERVRLLGQDGRGVLIVSYRGYGGSTGSPSERGLRVDARAAYSWLVRYAPERIVLYGESLGTGVAIKLATEVPVGGVILDSAYTSIADVARQTFWYVPVGLLMRDPFRSLDRIGRMTRPLLVLHGERDGIVPIAFGRRLFAAAREPKTFVALPGTDHVGVLETGGLAPVRAFLTEREAAFHMNVSDRAAP